MQINDIYGPDNLVHQWDLDATGHPGCFLDGLASGDPGALAALQKNAGVRALVGLVEPYEAAQALVALGQPDNGQPKQIPDPAWIAPAPTDPPTVPAPTAPLIANPAWALLPATIAGTDAQGQPTSTPEPRWTAYNAAVALIAAATPTTIAHALWRTQEPSTTDPAQADALTAWNAAKATVQGALATLAATPLAVDPRTPPFSADAVSAECKARILAVASTNCQINMAAARAAGILTPDQDTAFTAGLAWINAMRGACAALTTASDPTFTLDSHWPACPAAVVALAASF